MSRQEPRLLGWPKSNACLVKIDVQRSPAAGLTMQKVRPTPTSTSLTRASRPPCNTTPSVANASPFSGRAGLDAIAHRWPQEAGSGGSKRPPVLGRWSGEAPTIVGVLSPPETRQPSPGSHRQPPRPGGRSSPEKRPIEPANASTTGVVFSQIGHALQQPVRDASAATIHSLLKVPVFCPNFAPKAKCAKGRQLPRLCSCPSPLHHA